ncbi:MAG: DUF1150 family protein [Hyphomicrobiales bacterium]
MHKDNTTSKPAMTVREFALLGDGHVGYIKQISGEEAAELFGVESEIDTSGVFYALHAADGTCVSIADSQAAAEANAWEHELHTLAVH